MKMTEKKLRAKIDRFTIKMKEEWERIADRYELEDYRETPNDRIRFFTAMMHEYSSIVKSHVFEEGIITYQLRQLAISVATYAMLVTAFLDEGDEE
jgi:hypothetical protein